MSEQTTKPDTAAAPTVPSLAERIRALLPDHTHEQATGGVFAAGAAWTWTTPLGTWTVNLDKAHLLASSSLSFTGPGGEWTFAWPNDRGVEQLGVVLRALDAIGPEELDRDASDRLSQHVAAESAVIARARAVVDEFRRCNTSSPALDALADVVAVLDRLRPTVADHIITREYRSTRGYRSVCSCGQYRSSWFAYAGLAERAGRAHAKAKTVAAVMAKVADRG